MMNLMERHFRQTHETLNNHHLAIYYLSKGISALIPLMRRYRQAVTNYRLMVKCFLDGLDELSTGRLCYEVLDPITLTKYLRAITHDLDRKHSDYVLAFQHMYQYYAEPVVTFTNSPDYLLTQIPIFLVYKHQVPLTLFSTQTVPVPYDVEMYSGLQTQYTEVTLNDTYFAMNEEQYTLLTRIQLELCIKLISTYYCEQAYLLQSKDIQSCHASLYFDLSAEQKVPSCDFKYMQNKPYTPQVIDTGKQFVLSNLPQPWILMCENAQRPFTIPYSTYRIINHTELYECTLTAGYKYQVNKAQVECTNDQSPDSDFITYFVHNQAIADILSAQFQIDLPKELKEKADMLTKNIPQYNLPDLNWYEPKMAEFDNIFNSGTAVVDVSLINMLNDVTAEMKEQMYRSNEEFLMSQRNFQNYMAEAEWWQQMQFVTAILGNFMLDSNIFHMLQVQENDYWHYFGISSIR